MYGWNEQSFARLKADLDIIYRAVETSSVCPVMTMTDHLLINGFHNFVCPSHAAGSVNINTSSLVTVKDLTQKPETIIIWQNQQQCPYSDFF